MPVREARTSPHGLVPPSRGASLRGGRADSVKKTGMEPDRRAERSTTPTEEAEVDALTHNDDGITMATTTSKAERAERCGVAVEMDEYNKWRSVASRF